MKVVNMKKGDVKQLYIFPTIIIAKSYMGKRVFVVWLHWSIEL